MVGLYLNSANRLIGIHTISMGILNSSLVHPREVFKLAYMMSAASIIISHNHPSGNVEPSSEDLAITKQLVEAGKILGIPLHDHIIVTERNGFVSFAERGLL
jgi:DNA repair protein RadC